MKEISLPKHEWDGAVSRLLSSYDVYAPVENEFCCDYLKVTPELIPEIVYNQPKPVTPLKKFFIPVKENVTSEASKPAPLVILGTPHCDVAALDLLDAIYLDQEYTDPAYRARRENTTLVSAPCLSIQEHCHCTTYGIDPFIPEHSDLSMTLVEDQLLLNIYSQKGERLLEAMGINGSQASDREQAGTREKKQAESLEMEQGATLDPELQETLNRLREHVLTSLKKQNKDLPDHLLTGELISGAGEEVWKSYSADCVSCGACSAICPTCSCFLLIDKPGFEKIRQLDTCQYPGFERVAGGEDALGPLPERFRNRYMCKYVWKREQYQAQACTGCGRCIEACIGQINKNELIVELSK